MITKAFLVTAFVLLLLVVVTTTSSFRTTQQNKKHIQENHALLCGYIIKQEIVKAYLQCNLVSPVTKNQ